MMKSILKKAIEEVLEEHEVSDRDLVDDLVDRVAQEDGDFQNDDEEEPEEEGGGAQEDEG
jgi:hypothetical protein